MALDPTGNNEPTITDPWLTDCPLCSSGRITVCAEHGKPMVSEDWEPEDVSLMEDASGYDDLCYEEDHPNAVTRKEECPLCLGTCEAEYTENALGETEYLVP